MNINQLKDAFDMAGQKVQDLEDKRAQIVIDLGKDETSHSVDEITKLNASLKNAKINQELAKSAYEDAQANLKSQPINKKPLPVNTKGNVDKDAIKNQFVKEFKNMITSGTTGTGNGGLTIPDDVQQQIRTLVRQQFSLQSIVNVESVTTTHGSRTYEKLADITPLVELDEDGKAIGDNDDPELTVVKYLIHEYAGINTATNSLLKDTVANILQWLTNWIAKKVVVTRNLKILEVMNKAPKKPTIAKFDDVKDLENNTLDPAIESTSSFLTNQSGYNVLSKLKDADGRYLMQPDVTQPDRYLIDGKPVLRIADKWLPDVSGSHPLYFGDFKQAITLFDRENMELTTTNIGGGAFETNTTKVRVIDRFDVEMVDDGAIAVGSFKTVADQTQGTADTGK
ncbi:phage major capsid protein [Lactobacillus johnsonii]|uniref:Phage major capsid protein n=1 Tax=Lactobacillus taiwanensis TaxID=508451 RepID=A0A256LD60_9LACO|nr:MULTISPECIES: phage major capsid protein [Lactobacillus]MCT3382253.1 phage major capsid protein [Lactobacillus johnsonii]MCT3387283.1 phage major capsid protein [Lactobacillus johnsonii]OYR87465.1 phage major capsid protein [Lactobacillus taiwanensis]OYR91083.1 phage major capsid protein [Lactobacillus taiwanensis]OYR92545.1 phage major capsid protein [Lactobacillus taiwanensis]